MALRPKKKSKAPAPTKSKRGGLKTKKRPKKALAPDRNKSAPDPLPEPDREVIVDSVIAALNARMDNVVLAKRKQFIAELDEVLAGQRGKDLQARVTGLVAVHERKEYDTKFFPADCTEDELKVETDNGWFVATSVFCPKRLKKRLVLHRHKGYVASAPAPATPSEKPKSKKRGGVKVRRKKS